MFYLSVDRWLLEILLWSFLRAAECYLAFISGAMIPITLPSRASPCLPSFNSTLDRLAPTLRGRGVAVFVMPVPPLVRWPLRKTFGRILPFLLAPERGHVEV